MTVDPPKCLECIHYNDDLTCTAFPDDIPLTILNGEHDHTKPFKGDNGILFESVETGGVTIP